MGLQNRNKVYKSWKIIIPFYIAFVKPYIIIVFSSMHLFFRKTETDSMKDKIHDQGTISYLKRICRNWSYLPLRED